jgi:hypothetical protein
MTSLVLAIKLLCSAEFYEFAFPKDQELEKKTKSSV